MDNNKNASKCDRLYTAHGQKLIQGIPLIINGQKALATFKGDQIVGYTTLDELHAEFYTRKLPEYTLGF